MKREFFVEHLLIKRKAKATVNELTMVQSLFINIKVFKSFAIMNREPTIYFLN